MAAIWHRNDSLSLLLSGDNPSKGVKTLERLAKRGNVEAQLELGEIYKWGYPPSLNEWKIKPNIPTAIKWLKRAADQGDRRGYDRLWQIYTHKGNVDEEKALHYLLIAAQKGAVKAQRFLGICYMKGSILPVQENYSEGVKWLRKAAKSDDTDDREKATRTDSQMLLAKAYRDGTGVDVDLVKSYVWFSIAAHAEVVGQAQIERDKIAARLTTSQLIEAQNLTERCIATNCEGFD